MAFGIIVYEYLGRIYPFTMADDIIYEGMKKDMYHYGMNFLNGKKGINDCEIDDISKRVSDMVKRKNVGENLNLFEELELVLK